MKISVFGLGYVGAVSAACLADFGHTVIGTDIDPGKVVCINEARAPIIESGLAAMIQEQVRERRLHASDNAQGVVFETEISFICVGTPSRPNGSVNVDHLRSACETIGLALARKAGPHTVVVRSTVLPGTVREVVIPTLEARSGKKCGVHFGVAINPEFLREGSAITDFRAPPQTVIGATDPATANVVSEVYSCLSAPLVIATIEAAESLKYAANTWHALKVAFANEIGAVCKRLKVDSYEVMDIFCRDTRLNLSPSYLKPGFAFGGSCLPKDVRALQHKMRMLDLETPLISSILPSNRCHFERGLDLITLCNSKRIGVLGLSFKAGTDDLRESPMVDIIERLIGKGYSVRIYDRNVQLARLVGANRDYLLELIPHISSLMVPRIDDVLDDSDILVVGNADPEFAGVGNRLRKNQTLIDLVGVARPCEGANYQGICW